MTERRFREMTPEEARRDHIEMLWFLAFNALAGMIIGALTAFAIIWLDFGSLGTRIGNSQNPVLVSLMLVAPFTFIFGAAAAASAIMLLPYRKKFDR